MSEVLVMAVDWTTVRDRAARETVRFTSAPPFLIDGTLAPDIPLDTGVMENLAQAFRQADWTFTEQANGVLTTVVRVNDTVIPILMAAVATPSLLRVWVSAPALTLPNEGIDDLDVSLLYALIVQAAQSGRHDLAPPVADPAETGVWPSLYLGRSEQVPALGEDTIEIVALGAGRSLISIGLTAMVPHDEFEPSVGPWMAHTLAHAVAGIKEFSRHDAHAWNEAMPGIALATAEEIHKPVPGAWGQDVDRPPSAQGDQLMLLSEAGRHADAGDQEMAEAIWSELVRMNCPSSGSATNSWVFQVLNPHERYAEAQAYLMRVVLAGYEFESQNALSNLAVMMSRRGRPWAAVLVHAWLALLNDDRLRDETTYHLAKFVAAEGFPSLALTWLDRYSPSGLGSYDDDMTELSAACREQIRLGQDCQASDIFSRVLEDRPATAPPTGTVQRLVAMVQQGTSSGGGVYEEDAYRQQARVAQTARQPMVEMAWLGLSAQTAPSPSATDAVERMLEVFSDQTDEAVWSVVALAATRMPGRREGRILAALARSAMQLQCRTQAAVLAHWAAAELLADEDATVTDVITILAALADGEEESNSVQAMAWLALLDNLDDSRAKRARAQYTRDQGELKAALRADDEDLAIAALANRHMPITMLQELADGADVDLAWSIASAANCPADALHVLAGHRGESVRRAVAGHANTSPEDLDRLSGDDAWSVREAVRTNPTASDTARATAALLNGN